MHPPSPTWEADYSRSRRKHAHRCRCCGTIIKDNERVLMIRLHGFRGNKTWAIHVSPCADTPHSDGSLGWTWRDAMTCGGTEHLRRCGWDKQLPEHPMMLSRAKAMQEMEGADHG